MLSSESRESFMEEVMTELTLEGSIEISRYLRGQDHSCFA